MGNNGHMLRAEGVMKGCMRFNFSLEHKLSITQYSMEIDVIESLLKKDRSEVILSKCLPCWTKLYIFVGPLCNLIVKDLNFTAFFLLSFCALFQLRKCYVSVTEDAGFV